MNEIIKKLPFRQFMDLWQETTEKYPDWEDYCCANNHNWMFIKMEEQLNDNLSSGK